MSKSKEYGSPCPTCYSGGKNHGKVFTRNDSGHLRIVNCPVCNADGFWGAANLPGGEYEKAAEPLRETLARAKAEHEALADKFNAELLFVVRRVFVWLCLSVVIGFTLFKCFQKARQDWRNYRLTEYYRREGWLK